MGGASDDPFASLNLGILTEDDPDAVAENHRRLAAALGLDPARVAVAHQVHGADLLTHSDATALRCSLSEYATDKEQGKLPRADGHVIAESGVGALVLVADCLPVALAGPGGVAMLHCGWRGLAAGIVERGVTAIGATQAAIGPGIGPCCYEVGSEVLEAFAGLSGVARGRMLDLAAVAGTLLAEAGVEDVSSARICTSCEPALFFSHRRDEGSTGRQAGVAWLSGGED
jgi:YfiH family protein